MDEVEAVFLKVRNYDRSFGSAILMIYFYMNSWIRSTLSFLINLIVFISI